MDRHLSQLHSKLRELASRQINSNDAIFCKAMMKAHLPMVNNQIGHMVLRAALQRLKTGVVASSPIELLTILNRVGEDKSVGVLESTDIPINIAIERYDANEILAKTKALQKAYPEAGDINRDFSRLLPINEPDDIIYNLQVIYVILLSQHICR